jgi:hypothetical protein
MLSEGSTVASEWRGGGEREWQRIDRALRVLAKRRSALDADEMQLLACATRIEIWRQLGMVSLHEYLEHVLGYSPRQATERVRVATALEGLPELADALASGELHFSAVRELTRVATRETEQAWIDATRGQNLRQIEQAVAGRKRGDRPSDPADPELVAQTIRFDVRPATLALLRQAQQALEAERGERLDDDALIAALCNACSPVTPTTIPVARNIKSSSRAATHAAPVGRKAPARSSRSTRPIWRGPSAMRSALARVARYKMSRRGSCGS